MTPRYLDNDEETTCWHCGQTPTYFDHQGDTIHCTECDAVLWEDDQEPDRSDPDPDFHNSNAWDITTAGR